MVVVLASALRGFLQGLHVVVCVEFLYGLHWQIHKFGRGLMSFCHRQHVQCISFGPDFGMML
jgi:hypothetical protein